MVGDCYPLLRARHKELAPMPRVSGGLDAWWQRIAVWRARDCLKVTPSADHILPQHLMRRIDHVLTGSDAIISTDVGQHQMWEAQYIRVHRPKRRSEEQTTELQSLMRTSHAVL